MNHPHNPQVDRIFARWNKPDSPGFALAVSKADKIIYSRGYGMADLDHNIPITPATVFHAASLTKQFTAMCVMLLVGQGRLSLTDEVHKLIPELKHVGPHITIADMLHHISGIRDQWVLATMAGWRLSDDVVTRNDVLDLVKRMKTLNFRPGSAYSYSNTNYTLAGLIVEQVSGLLLSEFARQNIFVPLKMTSTAVADTHGLIVENRAYGYRATGHASFETRMPNYDLTGPTGLLTTVEDLMLWNHNFDSKVVGGKAALAAMQKPVANSNGYGLGLFISKEKGRRIVEHNGRDAGYRSHLIRFPGQKLAIALLGNVLLENIETDDLVRAVAAVYLKHKSVAAPQDAAEAPLETTGGTSAHPLKPADATEYLGRYYSEEIDTIYQIVLKGSSLQIVRKKYDPTPLYPLARDKFTMDDNFSNVLTTGALHFGRDARRKINGFRIDDTTPGSGNRLANFRFSKLPPK
jgi:CubicO group peptidase (beta-lactamase class C family)